MLIESPVGNLADEPSATAVDWIDLTWSECRQRAWRKESRGGMLVRALLRLGVNLRHGDVLHRGDMTIAVNVMPTEVVIAQPKDSAILAAACYELGNLHVPVQLEGDLLITLADGPVEGALEQLGIPYEVQIRRFEPTMVSVGQITLADQFALNRRPPSEQPIVRIGPLPPT